MISDTRRQLIRYAVVGVASNLLLYVGFLILNRLGFGNKMAMSIVYAVGVLQSFLLNRQWTFEHRGLVRYSMIRYVSTYLLGYAIYMGALYVLVDTLGFPSEIVVLFLIVAVAAVIFGVQKYWVFPNQIGQGPIKEDNSRG